MTLAPPTAYQGGKQRLAAAITDLIRPDRTLPFYDLCCGSGAVAIEQVNRGHNPSLIHMVDRGPWGLVWEAVGAGTFDLAAFGKWCDAVPADRSAVKGFLEELSHQPADADPAYVFLLLQAGSFGSKAIWIRENRWQNCTFRSYWMPTPTSSRRSPVNPMMPMPATLYSRMEALVVGLKGVHGRCGDVMEARPSSGTVYVDPPCELPLP